MISITKRNSFVVYSGRRGSSIFSKCEFMQRLAVSVMLLITITTFCNAGHNERNDFHLDDADDDLHVDFMGPMNHHVDATNSNHSKMSAYEKELASCPSTSNKIMLSLILRDHNWDEVIDRKCERAINKLSKFFAIPKDSIVTTNVNSRDLSEMSNNALRKGDNFMNNRKRTGKIEFVIGCGKEYFPTGQLIANQIAIQMNDESINEMSGLRFGWWIIWTKRVSSRMPRSKRETSNKEGSGEDDYPSYYDDDEEDATEVTPRKPIVDDHPHRHHHGDEKPSKQEHDIINNVSNKLINALGSTESILEPVDRNIIGTTKPQPKQTETKFNSVNEAPISREDVTQLESVITKTIENTNEQEVENEIEKIINERRAATEKVTLNIPSLQTIEIDDDFVPIVETISDDDAIEIRPKLNIDVAKSLDRDYVIEVNKKIDTEPKSNINFETELDSIEITTAKQINEQINLEKIDDVTMHTGNVKPDLDDTTVSSAITKSTQLLSTSSSSTSSQSSQVSQSSIATIPKLIVSSTTETPSTTAQSISASVGKIDVVSNTETNTEIETTTLRTNEITTIKEISQKSNEVLPPVQTTTEKSVEEDLFVPTDSSNYDEANYDDEYDDEQTVKTVTSSVVPKITASVTTESTSVEETTSTEKITTSSTTTSSLTTEAYVEPEIINNPPVIKARLVKLAVSAGKPFNHIVPLDTFYDTEDGTNLKLELLDKFEKPLESKSWIQFNPLTRDIYGLPLEDAVSKWQFKLRATDNGNESVVESLDISVQQHKSYRSVNHEIAIGIKLLENFVRNVDWEMRLIKGIVDILGDASSVLVRDIRYGIQDIDSATFIYTNESLPKDKCPEEKLDELFQRLTVSNLNNAVAPQIQIKSITGKPIGQCSKPDTVKPIVPKPTPHMTKNYPPVPRNQVDRVNASIGQLLVFKVPTDTFYDPEDGTDLKLKLITYENNELDPKYWLQFDSKNQEFYGVPKYDDAGQKEYVLVAEDREGLQATDALVVVVSHPPHREYSNAFEFTLNMPHEEFNNSALQRRFIERIAQIFHDPTTSNILIRSIRPIHQTGNTYVAFYNTTLHRPHNVCPTEEIDDLRNILLHHDGSIRSRVKDIIGNEFDLTKINFTPTGPCLPVDKKIHHAVVTLKPDTSDVASFKEEYLLTFVLPAIIIFAMLLLACIIACAFYRRRMTGKMELGDEEERKSFRSKGIPVIFQDELDEKPEIGNKSPIILKDEKPPLLPPSYNSTNPDDHEDMEDYIPPPAVMMSGRESRGKSPVTPSYRKPPPYVSP